MANIQTEIRKGIVSKLIPSGSNALKTAIQLQLTSTPTYGYKLFYHIAPQLYPGSSLSVAPPYVVFDILPITQDRDSANKFYDFTARFLVSASDLGTCENIAGYISDLLEDSESSLSFSGYYTIKVLRQPQINLGLTDLVWNIAVQFSISLQKI